MSAAITITASRTIDGGRLITLRAAAGTRHFAVNAGTTNIRGLTLTGGSVDTCGGSVAVGAGGRVVLDGTTITNNTTTDYGGGLCIATGGSLDLLNSSVTGNRSTAGGGAIKNAGSLYVRFSTIASNGTEGTGGGVFNSGASMDIGYSTVSSNVARFAGGGIITGGTSSIVTSTISSNSALSGGGISSTGRLSVSNSTIAFNFATDADHGAGFVHSGITRATLRNSILARNTILARPADCAAVAGDGAITSLGNNLIDDASCGFAADGDMFGVDPRLGPLSLGRGPTATNALTAGSPAIDTGYDAACGLYDQTKTTDPTSKKRMSDGNGDGIARCDIGAYEYASTAVPPTTTTTAAPATSFQATTTTVASAAGPAIAATAATTTTASTVVVERPLLAVPDIVAVDPARLLDTRLGQRRVSAGTTIEIVAAGRDGVPDDATAVVLGVTATDSAAAGYITVYPCGVARPTVSNLNVTPIAAVSNTVVVAAGRERRVCAFSSVDTDLVVDVNAYMPLASDFRNVGPARVLETRLDDGLTTVDGEDLAGGRRHAGSITEVRVTGRAGVATDAGAAVLTVTVTGAVVDGFITVFPCGSSPPLASNLNYVAGQTVANLAVAALGPGGRVCLFTSQAAHLVVDVAGYVPSWAAYEPLLPARLLESRSGLGTIDGQSNDVGRRERGSTTVVVVGGRGGVHAAASAVVLNVTVTEPEAAGYVTVFPCDGTRPVVSNINFAMGQTIANAVIARLGRGGQVCLYTSQSTHLVVDVDGVSPKP